MTTKEEVLLNRKLRNKFGIFCKICGEKFLTIQTGHLKKHNLTLIQYKERYGNTISNYSKEKFKKNGIKTSKRMKENNPMFNPVTVQKVSATVTGKPCWTKGYTKYTHSSLKSSSEKQKDKIVPEKTKKKQALSRQKLFADGYVCPWKGQNKNNCEARRIGGLKISQKLKGRTKDTHDYLKRISDKYKGKTFEQRFGKEKADKIKQKQSQSLTGKRKGLTYEEIYGPERAKYLRKQNSDSHKGKTAWNFDKEFYDKYGCHKSNYPYNDVFNDNFIKDILKRDNYTCQVTGMTNEEHKQKYGERLHIHHWLYNKNETNPFYFVTVSKSINSMANSRKNRMLWIDMFNGIMEDKYCEGLKCNNQL